MEQLVCQFPCFSPDSMEKTETGIVIPFLISFKMQKNGAQVFINGAVEAVYKDSMIVCVTESILLYIYLNFTFILDKHSETDYYMNNDIRYDIRYLELTIHYSLFAVRCSLFGIRHLTGICACYFIYSAIRVLYD